MPSVTAARSIWSTARALMVPNCVTPPDSTDVSPATDVEPPAGPFAARFVPETFCAVASTRTFTEAVGNVEIEEIAAGDRSVPVAGDLPGLTVLPVQSPATGNTIA